MEKAAYSPEPQNRPAGDRVKLSRIPENWRIPALLFLLLCVVILTIQTAGGAWQGEFSGHADEPGQFVSGLMVHDYLAQRPAGNPLDWAIRYYLHYPKIALGRWPPGFALIEAFWWILFAPSRISVILLEGTIALLSAMLFFPLAERLAGVRIALASTLLLVCSPIVAASYSSCMADAPCLLASVLVLRAVVRIVERPSLRAFLAFGGWVVFAISMKGTGALMALAPLLALGFSGQLRWLFNRRLVAAFAVVALIMAAMFLARPRLFLWILSVGAVGTLRSTSDLFLPMLAGYGVCVLAACGLVAAVSARTKGPLAVAAAACLVSVVSESFFVGAMIEPRHWIVALPSLLLLSLVTLTWVKIPPAVRVVAGAAAVALVPFHFAFTAPAGISAFVRRVHHPGRMMVAGTIVSTGTNQRENEGPWIAAVALAEKRPGSVVIRASKALASMDWNGNHYKLLSGTPAEIEDRLDELRVDTVVLYESPEQFVQPHLRLLRQLMSSSPSWRLHARSGYLSAWERVLPARLPAKPLQVDLRSSLGRIVSE